MNKIIISLNIVADYQCKIYSSKQVGVCAVRDESVADKTQVQLMWV